MKNKKEFNVGDLSTTQLLDGANKKPEYSDSKAWEKQQAYDNALEQKRPFSQLKQQVDRINKELRELRETVARLQVHKHSDGEVVIPEKAVESQKGRMW